MREAVQAFTFRFAAKDRYIDALLQPNFILTNSSFLRCFVVVVVESIESAVRLFAI
jgi:hypothetical protein